MSTYSPYGLTESAQRYAFIIKKQSVCSFFFLTSATGHPKDTDVSLDAMLGEVEDRPGLQRTFGYAECPLHHPQTVILDHNLPWSELCVCDVGL